MRAAAHETLQESGDVRFRATNARERPTRGSMRLIHVSAFVLAAACGGASASSSSTPSSSPVVATSAPIAVSSPSEYIPTLETGPFDALPKSLPTAFANVAKPAPVKRAGKTWPFHAWDRAEAVVMNWAPYGPDSEMHAYGANGWTQRLAYRAPLDASLAQRSVAIVLKEGGEILTTKCPVPRHAIVLFEGETPVASINVDFTCENVLLWPQPPSKAGGDAAEFLPRWRDVFAGELHFPMWDRKNDY